MYVCTLLIGFDGHAGFADVYCLFGRWTGSSASGQTEISCRRKMDNWSLGNRLGVEGNGKVRASVWNKEWPQPTSVSVICFNMWTQGYMTGTYIQYALFSLHLQFEKRYKSHP